MPKPYMPDKMWSFLFWFVFFFTFHCTSKKLGGQLEEECKRLCLADTRQDRWKKARGITRYSRPKSCRRKFHIGDRVTEQTTVRRSLQK